MHELFDTFPRAGQNQKNLIFLDTCFIIDLIEKEKSLPPRDNYAISSFTMEELIHVLKKNHHLRPRCRQFLKKHQFIIVETPVHPGEKEKEKSLVSSVDKDILKTVKDPSDAVLLVVAIKTHSTILTKDKHHLFTADLENFLEKYQIRVYKELKDLP